MDKINIYKSSPKSVWQVNIICQCHVKYESEKMLKSEAEKDALEFVRQLQHKNRHLSEPFVCSVKRIK